MRGPLWTEPARGSFLALHAARQALQQTASRAQDRGVAGFQIAVPAFGAADKKFTRQQSVAARGDGFGPVAGGTGVGDWGGRSWHTVAAKKQSLQRL